MKKFVLVLITLTWMVSPVWAAKYYEQTLESYTCDTQNPGGWYYENLAPYVRCSDTPPNGTKYLDYETVSTGVPTGAYTEINYTTHNITPGDKLYAGAFVKIQRKSGVDVFHEGNLQSYSKYLDFFIGGGGVRLVLCLGQQQSECYTTPNTNHKFSMWVMQGIYPSIACFDGHIRQNYGGYSSSNPIQLDYDRWHSIVLACTFSNGAGTIEAWVNGTKVMEYTGVNVTYSGSPSIYRVELMGTIAQSAYDAPPHYDRYDNLLVTDTWQDILDAGLMEDPAGGDTTPPVISTPLPSGTQGCSSHPQTVTLQVTTDESATCKYHTSDASYDGMPYTFSNTTGTTSHTNPMSLGCAQSYSFYVRCMDTSNNKDTSSTQISFDIRRGHGWHVQ